MENKTYTVKEAAVLADVGERRVRQFCKAFEIVPSKITEDDLKLLIARKHRK